MDQFEEQDYSASFDFGIWKKLLKYLMAYKSTFVTLMTSMVLLATCDTIFPLMSKYAIDNFIGKQTMEGFPIFAVLYSLLVLFQVTNINFFIRMAGKLEVNTVYDIRKVGFKRLQELSFSYYDKTPVGWIMARMVSDTQKIGDVVAWGLVDLVWGSTYVIAIAIVMFIINWKLALITLTVVPILAIVSIYFQRKILNGQREVRKTNSKITGAYNEGINGAKTTKTLNRESKNLDEFKRLTSSMCKSSVNVAIISSVYFPVVMGLGSVGSALALTYGGYGVIDNVITLGTLAAFISYAMQFFDPILQIARVLSEFQSAQASAERTLALVETELEITDTKEVIEKYGDAFNPKLQNWEKIRGDIVFKDVTFEYTPGTKILDTFNLSVRPGEKIALVGETGAGKSTIVNLICRFYEPSSGRIFIDGKDYKERSQIWLQSNLGYVLQTPHLFSGSIKENIRYAKLDATDEEVIKAAKMVHADAFIEKLEKGYDTDVGEGGNRLSTGEKQLVSFARAIISNPQIFVLDEATSSIDTETEQVIQKAIDIVLKGRTSFIVAHRLSTIRSADRILVIKDGKVIEEGSHKKLLALKGHYYNLYTNQFKEEAEGKALNIEKPIATV